MTTSMKRRRTPKGIKSPGNPYPEVDASKYDVSILAALDDISWSERIGVPRNLQQEELLLEIARAAATVQEHRARMVVARVRLVELTLYAVFRVGLRASDVAKAAGMRVQALDRWMRAYRKP